MTHDTPQGQLRPAGPVDPFPDPIPLLGLRGSTRRAIAPEACRVRDCPVCAMRERGEIPPVSPGGYAAWPQRRAA